MENMNFTSKRTDAVILEAINRFMQRGHGVAFPEIAEHVGCSRDTVIRSVGRLERTGRLEVLQEKGKPNRYRVVNDAQT